jgi:imidazolonepropionase-like amidohydrolase
LISAYEASVLPVRISAKDQQTPTIKISENHAGYDLNLWQDLVYYQEGNQLYFYHAKDAFLDHPTKKDAVLDQNQPNQNQPNQAQSSRFHQTQIQLHLPTENQNSPIIIYHARIITANGDQVLEDAGLYIENQRIKAIAKSEDLLEAFSMVPNVLKLDAKGKTLMPGMIDVHAHASYSNDRIIPKQNWQLYASLAFGVTTLHDPSSDSVTVFSTSEMLKSNRLVGPRLFSTGTILYGAKGDYHASIQKTEDAMMHVQKLKQMGAFSVKSYNQPQRIQRQQVLWAARQLGMMVVPEGGSVFYHNMTQIIDGHTGIEHAIPLAHLYEDVLQLWSATKVGYTPTFNVSYGGIMGENYWYQESAVYQNERLKRFVPSALIESRSRRPFTAPAHEWNHIDVAKHSKKLLDRGVLVNLGAHGQREGLGAHWEMWSMVQGGFSPLEAIKAGTINGAKYLGLDRDLGTIEVGKLADLILIDGNPLANIRESEKVAFVMVSGKLYDAKTMGVLTNQSEIDQMQAKQIPHFFFEDSQIRFDHDDLSHCGCEP